MGSLTALKFIEFDVLQLALHALEATNVDVLDDVTRFGIDGDRASRAFPCHAFHCCDDGVTIRVAARLLQSLVDQVHSIVGSYSDRIRTTAIGGMYEAFDKCFVRFGSMRGGILQGRDGS